MFSKWFHQVLRVPFKLHVRTYGTRGPTLIFLHGIAAQGSLWNPTIKHLSQHYRCVVIDLLGHGQSPKPDYIRYDTETHTRSLRYTLKRRGLTGKHVFIGHSMGSIIATHYAATYKSSVKGLVLVSMPIYLKRNSIEKPRMLEGFLDSSYLRVYRTMRRLSAKQAMRAANMIAKNTPRLIGQFHLDEHTWYPFVSSLAYTIEEQAVGKDLKQVPARVPIRVLYGSLDNLVISGNLKQAFKDRKHTKLIRMRTSHELSEESARIISRTVQELAPSR